MKRKYILSNWLSEIPAKEFLKAKNLPGNYAE
jgi:hypothetical protein